MTNKVYCFDTNIFINLYNHYPPKIASDIWEELDIMIKEEKIISHITVYKELVPDGGPNDEIGKWVHQRKKIFVQQTAEQLQLFEEILKNHHNLIDSQRKSNKEQADPYLVAMISLFKKQLIPIHYTLVTNESHRSPHKLPAVCKDYDIECIDLMEFFVQSGWQFSLKKL